MNFAFCFKNFKLTALLIDDIQTIAHFLELMAEPTSVIDVNQIRLNGV